MLPNGQMELHLALFKRRIGARLSTRCSQVLRMAKYGHLATLSTYAQKGSNIPYICPVEGAHPELPGAKYGHLELPDAPNELQMGPRCSGGARLTRGIDGEWGPS